MIELPTPETDALFWKHGYPVKVETSKAMLLCKKLENERDWTTEQFKCLKDAYSRSERERDEAQKQNAKLRDIAERAIVPLECDGVPWGAKLRAELDQLKEGAKWVKEEAREALKAFKLNKKHLCDWLALQIPDINSKMTLPYIYIEYPAGHPAYPQGSRVPWLASQTDILAEDWETVD
jgi:hypothetical protein